MTDPVTAPDLLLRMIDRDGGVTIREHEWPAEMIQTMQELASRGDLTREALKTGMVTYRAVVPKEASHE